MTSSRRQATADRLLTVAADLFYRDGIHATGIDRIVAEAGLTKPTFYTHFPSKSDLVTAVLSFRSKRWQAAVSAHVEKYPANPRRQILAVFDFIEEFVGDSGFRGCALVNGSVELAHRSDPGRAVASRNKAWNRDLLEECARRARLRKPRALASSLVLLIEGAISSAYVEGNSHAGKEARAAARQLITAHSPRTKNS